MIRLSINNWWLRIKVTLNTWGRALCETHDFQRCSHDWLFVSWFCIKILLMLAKNYKYIISLTDNQNSTRSKFVLMSEKMFEAESLKPIQQWKRCNVVKLAVVLLQVFMCWIVAFVKLTVCDHRARIYYCIYGVALQASQYLVTDNLLSTPWLHSYTENANERTDD